MQQELILHASYQDEYDEMLDIECHALDGVNAGTLELVLPDGAGKIILQLAHINDMARLANYTRNNRPDPFLQELKSRAKMNTKPTDQILQNILEDAIQHE